MVLLPFFFTVSCQCPFLHLPVCSLLLPLTIGVPILACLPIMFWNHWAAHVSLGVTAKRVQPAVYCEQAPCL